MRAALSPFLEQIPKESIPQLSRRRLDTDPFLGRELRHVIGVDVEFQIVLASQAGDEFLIRLRLRAAQLVIEMNNRKDNPEFAPQFEQQTQERDRINSAGNGHADAIPSL